MKLEAIEKFINEKFFEQEDECPTTHIPELMQMIKRYGEIKYNEALHDSLHDSFNPDNIETEFILNGAG